VTHAAGEPATKNMTATANVSVVLKAKWQQKRNQELRPSHKNKKRFARGGNKNGK